MAGESPPPKRRRRTPEEARDLILGAARSLFAHASPDSVGLKEVAKQAGVSHGLISHYFGTYNGLVEAVLQSHVKAMRSKLFGTLESRLIQPQAWIEHMFRTLHDPLMARLLSWALLSGRYDDEDFFPSRDQGLRTVLDRFESIYRKLYPELEGIAREDMEAVMVASMCAAFGHRLFGRVFWAGLGNKASEAEQERQVRKAIEEMVLAFLRARGVVLPQRDR